MLGKIISSLILMTAPFAVRATSLPTSLHQGISEAAPTWARWNFQPSAIKIPKSFMTSGKRFLYGIICSGGELCAGKMGSLNITATYTVSLQQDQNNILLLDPSGRQIESWQILQNLSDSFMVQRSGSVALSTLPLYEGLFLSALWNHDQRNSANSLIFHESRLAKLPLKFAVNGSITELRGIYTIYLQQLPLEPMEPKAASKSFGFFTVDSPRHESLITRWKPGKRIEWIVESDVPADFYQIIQSGVLAWNTQLQGLKLSVRRALPGEELDFPLKNVIRFQNAPAAQIAGGLATLAVNPLDGEILFSHIGFTLPANGFPEGDVPKNGYIEFPAMFAPVSIEEYKKWLQYHVSHEIGHSLGLRHNFLGSAMECSKHLSGGASIMDYLPPGYAPEIGPYDIAAIRWAYDGARPEPGMKYCTDEDLESSPECKSWDKPCR